MNKGILHVAAAEVVLDLASCPRFGACSRCLAALELDPSFVEALEESRYRSTAPPEREFKADKRSRERGAHGDRGRRFSRAFFLFFFAQRQSKIQPHQFSLSFSYFFLSFTPQTGRALVPVR